MKKLLSLVLTLVLCLGLAVSAEAFDMGASNVSNTLATSYSYTAAIDTAGTLILNNRGTLQPNVPAKIRSISCGQYHSAAISNDGSLWVWGDNNYGQIGNGSNINIDEAVKVLNDVTAVSCGGYHTAAIKTDGSLWMWGANYLGQLGIGNLEDSDIPVKVMDDVVAVSCGGDHTAVIKTDGSLWMFGCNNTCQLGDGWGMDTTGKSKFKCRISPVKVLDDVVAVSCGWVNTAAITSDGTLWLWGSNGDGELGNGGVGNDEYNGYVVQTTPIKVMNDVSTVSCGWHHIAAVKDDGTLWMWGLNRYGQLGNGWVGNETNSIPSGYYWFYQTIPVKVMDGVTDVSCGYNHTAAIKSDGSVWAWGQSIYDSQGNIIANRENEYGSKIIQTIPVKIADNALVPTPPSPTVAGFNDVHESDYFADAVAWAKDSGITGGTTATTFSPASTVTRAQAVTFLWRAAGSPEPAALTSPFTDVTDPDAYYYQAVLWAAEQGITTGVTAAAFGTDSAVAYDQMLAFLARAAGAETGGGSWSDAAIRWAADNGLTDGLTFSAKSACPRSDVVYCLWMQLA